MLAVWLRANGGSRAEQIDRYVDSIVVAKHKRGAVMLGEEPLLPMAEIDAVDPDRSLADIARDLFERGL